jgi:hypothetical protein
LLLVYCRNLPSSSVVKKKNIEMPRSFFESPHTVLVTVTFLID